MLPTSASTRRSCTSSPNRARTSCPIESSSIDVRGRNGSSAARALPRQDSNRVLASGASCPGTPSSRPSGMRCSAVVPDRGVHRFGRHQFVSEADLRGQLRRVRHTGEEGVGATVDHVEAGEPRPADPAAGAFGRLEHRDVERCRAGELPRCGEARDPGTDHGDPAVLHRLAFIGRRPRSPGRPARPSRRDRR